MSKYHDRIKYIATRYSIDIDRVKAAVEQYMQHEDMHLTWQACEVIQARIEAHQYPEPYVVPEQEKCINCFQPKDQHLPQCGLGSNADVPGWMKGEEVKKEEVPEEKLEEPWPCRCGAGGPKVIHPEPGQVWAQLECTCGARCYYKNFATATKQWNKHNGVQPEGSWDNLPPCSCGHTDLDVHNEGVSSQITCKRCKRFVCASLTNVRDQGERFRKLVLKVWMEGKGEAGKIYYVENGTKSEHVCNQCRRQTTILRVKDFKVKDAREIRCKPCGRVARAETVQEAYDLWDKKFGQVEDKPDWMLCGCGSYAELTTSKTGYSKLVCRCGRKTLGFPNKKTAQKQWERIRNGTEGKTTEYSWDNLPPCTCGSELIGTNSISGIIDCNDCERYLMRVCASTHLDQIARAWAEGKGKRGEVYRVEIDHEPAPHPAVYFDSDHRGTVDSASPVCGCGNKVMWDDTERREYKLICVNDVSCHRQTSLHQSPEAAREEWRSLNQFEEAWKSLNQIDQVAPLANGPKEKNDQLPTWENPGPCRCGWDKHFRGAGDRGAHIGCRRHGCNRTVMRSDKVTTLAAWVGGETA